jgi:hypothetical protein
LRAPSDPSTVSPGASRSANVPSLVSPSVSPRFRREERHVHVDPARVAQDEELEPPPVTADDAAVGRDPVVAHLERCAPYAEP